MQLKRITHLQDELLNQLIPLYEESFPEEERRPNTQLMKMIESKKEMHFTAIIHEGELCGLFVYWDFKDFFYLEHLAVFPAMRNRKIGEKVLAYLTEHLKGLHLLEVEPPATEMAGRRIEYYRRNGYEVLHKEYIQPSYSKDKDALNLWIMGNAHSDLLPERIEKIKKEVYINNRNRS